MDCDRIRDLLPDYHLGHLTDDEAAEVRRHLAEHPECREALAEVAEVVDLVPLSTPPLAPPPELKHRILARIEEDARHEEAPEERPVHSRAGRRGTPLLLASALGAALVALFVLGFAYVGLDRENARLQAELERLQQQAGGGGGLQVLTASGTGLAPEARGTLVADPSDGSMALAVYGLPEPPAEGGYHAWLINDNGEPVSLGEMDISQSGEGQMTGKMEGPADSYSEVEITRQPEGTETHSGEVVLQAEL